MGPIERAWAGGVNRRDALIDGLAEALVEVWERLGLALNAKPLAAE